MAGAEGRERELVPPGQVRGARLNAAAAARSVSVHQSSLRAVVAISNMISRISSALTFSQNRRGQWKITIGELAHVEKKRRKLIF